MPVQGGHLLRILLGHSAELASTKPHYKCGFYYVKLTVLCLSTVGSHNWLISLSVVERCSNSCSGSIPVRILYILKCEKCLTFLNFIKIYHWSVIILHTTPTETIIQLTLSDQPRHLVPVNGLRNLYLKIK